MDMSNGPAGAFGPTQEGTTVNLTKWEQYIQQNNVLTNVDPLMVESYVQARLDADRARIASLAITNNTQVKAEAAIAVEQVQARAESAVVQVKAQLQTEAAMTLAGAEVRARAAETRAEAQVQGTEAQARRLLEGTESRLASISEQMGQVEAEKAHIAQQTTAMMSSKDAEILDQRETLEGMKNQLQDMQVA